MVNWPLFLGLLVSLPSIIVILLFILIPIYLLLPIYVLLAYILLMPVLVRAGYLVARQGQPSFGEVFRDLSSLLKIFAYELTLLLILWILLRMTHLGWWASDILVVADFIILFLSFLAGQRPIVSYRGERGSLVQLGRAFPSLGRTLARCS